MINSHEWKEMRPSDDPHWEQYIKTRLEIFDDHSLVIDLSRPIPPESLVALRDRGIGPTFAVLTACNPHGVVASEAANQHFSQLLELEVNDGGWIHVRADGVSPDAQHRERGLAVAMPKADALAFARKYGQSAFYWFDGASMWIVGALVATPDIRLPA